MFAKLRTIGQSPIAAELVQTLVIETRNPNNVGLFVATGLALTEDGSVHTAVDVFIGRVRNLGWQQLWSHRGDSVPVESMRARSVIDATVEATRSRMAGWLSELVDRLEPTVT